MYQRELGGFEVIRGVIGLKSSFLGILIWLPVTVVLFSLQWDGPWQLSPIGVSLPCSLFTFCGREAQCGNALLHTQGRTIHVKVLETRAHSYTRIFLSHRWVG